MLVLVLVGDAAVVIGKRDIGLRLVAARDDLAASGDAYVGIAGDQSFESARALGAKASTATRQTAAIRITISPSEH